MAVDLPDWSSLSVTPPRKLLHQDVAPGPSVVILTVPAGTHGIAVLSTDATGNLVITSLRGHQSGDFYWSPGAATPGGAQVLKAPVLMPVTLAPEIDSQLELSWTNNAAATLVTVDVVAVFDVEAFINSASTPLAVSITGTPGVDVTDRPGRLLGAISPVGGAQFDVSDRPGRAVGQVSAAAGALFDVSDRAARLLGVADVSDRAARVLGQVSAAAGALFDVSDRAARLLGFVQPYGASYPTVAAHGTIDAYAATTGPAGATNLFTIPGASLVNGAFYDVAVIAGYGAAAGPQDDIRVFINGAFLNPVLVNPIANSSGPEQVWRRMFVGNPATVVALQTIAGSGAGVYRANLKLIRVS